MWKMMGQTRVDTHPEKGCDTQEDERHSILIFTIFDANLWVYFWKPQKGVSFFVHVKSM